MPSPVLHEVALPDLGLNEMEQRVFRWLKATGSNVVAEDPLLEIVAAGVCVTLPAPVSGRLLAQLVKENEIVRSGQHLGMIECSAEDWE